ncbi:MAG: agmatine deiminase family protein [Cryomorphaceae bacterium]|nr:agmatine deiminase family protein [Cryomorphaceae bacterium]
MIPNKDSNTVYLSSILNTDKRFEKNGTTLTSVLDKHAIPYAYLDATKDIWCRDYMPIQIDVNKLVQFRFDPSYLKGYQELQSDPKVVCAANNIHPEFSTINLDGGNVVQWSDKAIISDRIFDENPEYTNKNELISELEKCLGVEVIIIPQIKSDMTGHVDGMLRFVDENVVVGNDRTWEDEDWSKEINKILKEKNIDYIDIPFLDHKIKNNSIHAIGCYVNYLEVGNLIILPIFEVENNQDQAVYDQMTSIFPDRIIETINFNDVGRYGGLLNCVTWNIKR